MSFSGKVKEELTNKIDAARHCQIAELSALLLGNGKYEPGFLDFPSENIFLEKKYFTLIKKTFNIWKDICSEEKIIRKGSVYHLVIDQPLLIARIMQAAKLEAEPMEDGFFALRQKDTIVYQHSCCKRAFLRGTFLTCGSISDPRKGYHLEFVCPDEEKACQIREVIERFELDAHIIPRKKSFIVYMKEADQIVDMLAVMGANVALMDLENIRILKEISNSVNRQVNCETANLNKTVLASVKQTEDIRLIEKTMGFEKLKEGLADIAVLRLQYPDATLKELGMMLSPQVGKSGVNHRLRKLSEIADDLRSHMEEDS